MTNDPDVLREKIRCVREKIDRSRKREQRPRQGKLPIRTTAMTAFSLGKSAVTVAWLDKRHWLIQYDLAYQFVIIIEI